MTQIHSNMDLMASQPVLFRKLICGQKLERLASSRPLIKEVSAPSLRRNQHVVQSLAVGIAVEPRVLRQHAENCAGIQLVLIGEAECHALLIQVVRGRLRNEGIDTGVSRPQRESVNRERYDLLWRKNGLQGTERTKTLFLGDVVGPRQSAHGGLFHVVLKKTTVRGLPWPD